MFLLALFLVFWLMNLKDLYLVTVLEYMLAVLLDDDAQWDKMLDQLMDFQMEWMLDCLKVAQMESLDYSTGKLL